MRPFSNAIQTDHGRAVRNAVTADGNFLTLVQNRRFRNHRNHLLPDAAFAEFHSRARIHSGTGLCRAVGARMVFVPVAVVARLPFCSYYAGAGSAVHTGRACFD